MTKSTITRERLQELAEGQSGFNLRTATHEESQELARMALAAMDSEPVAYISKSDFDAGYPHILARRDFNKACTMPVYAAQRAPVVPEEKPIPNTLSMYAVDAVAAIAEVKGWNACRAAMLAAAPQSPGGDHATVPGKWIPVSERMPDREVDVQVYCPDKKEQMVAYLERNELDGYFRFATWRTGDGIYCQPTHWMQLPAGPQEVKGE
ncbi:TPA: DUF551 domain-containing protein [Klebsiella pneumoniae]|nr:DUF551 domain-containing protein [Klebsiella pneumoniae]RTR17943.1 DUF551 domain-containing protein [Klebsiella pneumoniae]